MSFNLISHANEKVDEKSALTSQQRYNIIEDKLFDKPYTELPQFKVKSKFFGSSKKTGENKLSNAANRTFKNSADLIELATKQKLLNPNGICFTGMWEITKESQYSGLFKGGSKSPVIVRASTALNGTTQKTKRAFGMGIKFLPDDIADQPSLNAFVFHSITGTVTPHVLDLVIDNEPPLGALPKLADIPTALRIRRDLERADKNNGAIKPDATYRPVTNLAQYQTDQNNIIAPRWLRLKALTTQRIDQNDFRDELRVENYSEKKIVYQVDIAGNNNDKKSKKKNAVWQTIGTLELLKSVTSPSCDLNLHFQHPKLS